MGKGYMKIASMNTLIAAVQKYIDDLNQDANILLNAANVCDMAMGSDDNAQKHIKNLNEALKELYKTIALAKEVKTALINDRNAAMITYED